MTWLMKLLVPKLYFSLADQGGDGGAPEGQPVATDDGNGDGGEGGEAPPTDNPTDFVDFKGVKIPASEFETLAKERFKDAFEAQSNRDKWSAENTRRAQEIKQLERDAEAYRRLQSDQRSQAPKNGYEQKKREYVEKKSRAFPDVDPRFFESTFDDMHEISGARAQESLTPILEQQSVEWEKQFLASHPLVKKGSYEYYELGNRIEKGYDPEDAYRIVYAEKLGEQTFQDRLKRRDEEAKRKLNSNRQTGTEGKEPVGPRTKSDIIWKALKKHGIGD